MEAEGYGSDSAVGSRNSLTKVLPPHAQRLVRPGKRQASNGSDADQIEPPSESFGNEALKQRQFLKVPCFPDRARRPDLILSAIPPQLFEPSGTVAFDKPA